ncbi:hypothetical protein GpartN1_g7431.t1 [Galdieria partita]|uniref:Uncharacterized protein n=1 Tax=Galdieria partita TaxID=83374 RepID=A0A9C7UUM0_9RHOD|nr:hypothetical protein GpartN1_g7431.t1 [Galdieria partita]
MEEDDLEKLLEEESRQKEQEDSQTVQQIYEQEGVRELDEYWTELVGDYEDDELEALLEQELEQKQLEDRQESQLPFNSSGSKEGSGSYGMNSCKSPLSVTERVFQVEEFSVKPYLIHSESEWRKDPEQPPLALQWTQEQFELFCQQVIRLGPSALEQPWLLAKRIPSKNALECLLLYEALYHEQYDVKTVLHPNKFFVQKETYSVQSFKDSLSSLTWEKLLWRYQYLITSTVERGFPTPSGLKCYEPWSADFWLRLSIEDRRLLALADWHILLSFCNSVRSSNCPPIVGADPRVLVRILAYTCDYMRYVTRVALSFAVARSQLDFSSSSVVMNMYHVSQAIDIANEYYRYRGNHRLYLGTEWMRHSIVEYSCSYDILEEIVDDPLPLDDSYDLVLLDYGWLDGKKHYACIPKSLQVVPVTDLYFHGEWWHPQRHPSYKDLSNHLLVGRLVQRWLSLWLGEESEAEWKESYEWSLHPLSMAQTNNCQVPLLCRQWIGNVGCYYLAYQCRQLVKYLSLTFENNWNVCSSNHTTESNGIYFEYFHWHMLQMDLEEHVWRN